MGASLAVQPSLRPKFPWIDEILRIDGPRPQEGCDPRSLRNGEPTNSGVDIRFQNDKWRDRTQAHGFVRCRACAREPVRRLERVGDWGRSDDRVGFAANFRGPLRVVAEMMDGPAQREGR